MLFRSWSGARDGLYRGTFVSTGSGTYEIAVDSSRGSAILGSATAYVRAGPSDAEYFDAAMRAPFMRRVAEETGGRFYRAEDTSTLVDAITYSGRGITVTEDRELWDMPIVLLLALAFMGAEWGYRRSRGVV